MPASISANGMSRELGVFFIGFNLACYSQRVYHEGMNRRQRRHLTARMRKLERQMATLDGRLFQLMLYLLAGLFAIVATLAK